MISGAAIVSVVLSLPTTGPMLLDALRSQDMYLAGSFLMFLALLTVVGMLHLRPALAALDPRIRLGGGASQMSSRIDRRSPSRLRPPAEHYVATEPFDPYVASRR